MQKWECPCGYIYDPATGDEANGVALEQPGKMYLKIGFVLSVVPKKRHSGKQTDFVLTPVDVK